MNNDDGVQQKRPDGTWEPAVPLPYPPTWIERVKKFLGLPTWETRKELNEHCSPSAKATGDKKEKEKAK